MHDLSKFRPDEFVPYARHFFGNGSGGIKTGRSRTGYYKAGVSEDRAFDHAWFLHQKRNRHHWQWWVMPVEAGEYVAREMDAASVREMVADWRGAGRAQGTPDTIAWYMENGGKMRLGRLTRARVERLLGIG